MSLTLIEDLKAEMKWMRESFIYKFIKRDSHFCNCRFCIIQPILPTTGKFEILGIAGVFESLNATVNSPQ